MYKKAQKITDFIGLHTTFFLPLKQNWIDFVINMEIASEKIYVKLLFGSEK